MPGTLSLGLVQGHGHGHGHRSRDYVYSQTRRNRNSPESQARVTAQEDDGPGDNFRPDANSRRDRNLGLGVERISEPSSDLTIEEVASRQ